MSDRKQVKSTVILILTIKIILYDGEQNGAIKDFNLRTYSNFKICKYFITHSIH